MKTPFVQTVLAILRKDLQAELRSRELISLMLMFTLMSILIFSFALELNRVAREEAITGVLWVTVVFSSILGLNRSMVIEREQGSMDAMLLAPISRTAIFMGKFLANFLFTFAVGLLLLPLMTVLYNKALTDPRIVLILLLGTGGFCVAGTLISAMTTQTRAREALLPIALLPIVLPALLAAVRASTGILTDSTFDDWFGWAQILIAADVLYVVLAVLLFQYAIEE
ncbi:MAG: heme exporter protein CcmB [Aggregatilineales bacterium]